MPEMGRTLIIVVAATWLFYAATASAQQKPPPAPRLPPLASAATNPYVNQSAGLRAAPLPRDSLSGSSAPLQRAPYSVPYGPHFSRPSGSPIVPFGSSRYYYHR